jgi:hypothetical protein
MKHCSIDHLTRKVRIRSTFLYTDPKPGANLTHPVKEIKSLHHIRALDHLRYGFQSYSEAEEA